MGSNTDEQVHPNLTSSKQTSSAWLNKQVNPLNSNTSSSSAENLRSSSAVDGAWVEEARGDVEERGADKRMCSSSCSKPWFSLNQTNKLACPSLLLTSGYQHPLLPLMLLALQIWDTLLLK